MIRTLLTKYSPSGTYLVSEQALKNNIANANKSADKYLVKVRFRLYKIIKIYSTRLQYIINSLLMVQQTADIAKIICKDNFFTFLIRLYIILFTFKPDLK